MDKFNLLKRLSCITVSLVVGLSPLPLYASDDLNVEGISHDAGNPEGSIAVVNGTFLREGDVYQNYKIIKIGPNSVRVANTANGSEEDMYITGGEPATASAGNKASDSRGPVSQETAEKNLQEAMTNPLAFLSLAREVAILADMRKVHTAAAVYYSEYGGMETDEITIEKLIERGLLSRAFEGGVRSNYQISIKAGGNGVGVAADPVESSSNAKHFYIDEHGELFENIGGPASDKSKPRGGGLDLPKMPPPEDFGG